MRTSIRSETPGMADLKVQGLTRRFRVELNRRVQATPLGETPWSEISENVTESAQESEFKDDTYVITWRERERRLQLDKGNLPASKDLALGFEIGIQRYGKRVSIGRRQLFSRQEGASKRQEVAEMGDDIQFSQREDFWDRLLLGDTNTYGLAYDGTTFFSDSHPGRTRDGSVLVQSNLDVTNLALNEPNLQAALTQLESYKDNFGVNFRPDPILLATQSRAPMTSREEQPSPGVQFVLFVGRNNRGAAHNLAKMATSDPQQFAGTFRYEVIDRISDAPGAMANSWFVWRPGFSPLAHVMEVPEFDVSGPGSKSWNDDYRAEWFIRVHWGFGYWYWNSMFYARHL